jgi:uracil-DNA glycosylase
MDDLHRIAAEVRTCPRCRLAENRTHAVPGDGHPRAELFLLGEAPGAREDETGLPFQGASGRFFDASLAELGLGRADVFVTGTAKCRPPGNRDPRPDEVAACAPYLDRQLALIRPRVVLAMGLVAARRLGLAPKGAKLGDIRGEVHEPGAADPAGAAGAADAADGAGATRPFAALATYHPAAAMRFPRLRGPFLTDLATAADLADHAAVSAENAGDLAAREDRRPHPRPCTPEVNAGGDSERG